MTRIVFMNDKRRGVVGSGCPVAVGYIYEHCASRPYWEVQSAMIAGCDMMSSEIGGWNVDVHHVYSLQEGTMSYDGCVLRWKTRRQRYVSYVFF